MKRTKLFQHITVIITTVAVVAGFSNLIPLEVKNVPKAEAATKMIIFWDDAAYGGAPAGWTYEAGYVSKMIRGNSTAGGTGGSDSHTHTINTTGTEGSNTGTSVQRKGTNNTASAQAHNHTSITSSSMSTDVNNSLPAYRSLQVLSCDAGIPTVLPQYAIVMFDAAVPATFTRYSAQDAKFVRGGANSNVTGGTSSPHSHSAVALTTSAASLSANTLTLGAGATLNLQSHTHSLTGGTTDSDAIVDPLHTHTILGYANAANTPIVNPMIAAFQGGTAPTGWTSMSDVGGDFYQVFIEGQSAYGTGNGAASHHHHKAAGYTLETTNGTTAFVTGVPATTGSTSHADSIAGANITTSEGNNLPAYIDVVIAKKDLVYTPASTEWRWADAEQTADPADTLGTDIFAGDTIANQSSAPSSTRIVYDGNALKLRFGVTETAGVAGTDVKFHLEYDTSNSFSSATDVGGIGQVVIWRYYNGVDTNDTSITTRLLTTTTANGTHNETGGSTSSSTFDPAASTATEFEFTIQNNGATANTQYFFRLYYIENSSGADTPAGVVPPVVGNNYPTLTTAAAYDLEISTAPVAPANVSYGSIVAGTDTKQYVFSAGEKIGFWDKRSTAASYTVSVSGTDMTSGGNTISNSNITWTSTTGVLNVGFTSVTTNMTGQTGATLDTPRTAYAASAGYGKGGFYFSPTIDLAGLSAKPSGNYTGTITITIT